MRKPPTGEPCAGERTVRRAGTAKAVSAPYRLLRQISSPSSDALQLAADLLISEGLLQGAKKW